MSGLALGLTSAVLGAGATAYGASQQPEGVQQHSLPVIGFNPLADPLLSALTMNAGAGVGQFDPNTYRQASPVQQLIAQAQQSGNINRRQFRTLQAALGSNPALIRQAAALKGPERRAFLEQHGIDSKTFGAARHGLPMAEQLASSAGFGGLDELLTSNQQYLDKLPEIQAQFQPVADQLRSGILSSQGRIGQYMQDLPNLLTGEANPFIDQLRQEALITSQKYGVNPYQFLEQARSTALQRALQLIGGEQAVQAGQQQAALPIAQLRQQGGATAANVGASQAAMLAQALQSQQSAQSAQAATYGNLGAGLLRGGFGLIGASGGSSGPATGDSSYYGGGRGGGSDSGSY